MQKTIRYVQQRKFFLGGLVSLPALRNGGMCAPNTDFLTANAFEALNLGHMTIPQLATVNLLPIRTVNTESLLSASYINRVGQTHALTALGIQASLVGHIVPSQLQSLSLYPLQGESLTSSFLQQAGYLYDDCLPTALGIAASYIRYLPNNFASSACQSAGEYPMTIERLVNSKYIYGNSKIITAVGLVAMQSGFITRDTYRNFGCYPFVSEIQSQSSEYVYQEQQQTQVTSIVGDLIHTGYFHDSNLISSAGYYALTKSYFSIDNFRSLNLWPCPATLNMDMFVSAGYASYSGHLTKLGDSLYHAQYFPFDLLPKLGIHIHDDFSIYNHALSYGGFGLSSYHEAHAAIRSGAIGYAGGIGYPSYNGVQTQVGILKNTSKLL